jgi:Ca2+-binding EF-hand superfamily protein
MPGYISRDNLRDLLGKHSSDAFIDVLMREADAEKDGRITYEQFRKVVSRTHTQSVVNRYKESERLSVMPEEECDDESMADAVLQRYGLLDGEKTC